MFRLFLHILFFSFAINSFSQEKLFFNRQEENSDVFFGMLTKKNNQFYIKKCSIISEEMLIVDEKGVQSTEILSRFKEIIKKGSKIQLETIATVKENKGNFSIHIIKIKNIIINKSCLLLDSLD
ncbi:MULTISPECIES: hypothetical protein [Flavobacterium]|uniref:Uncharacterized protein n=2 Tax=Flavobacterium covae TaxID=2906076 RepID=A0ABW8PCR7_9FLAO|nr:MULTISPECIES: hypothetical protein [Flavobacterium]